MLSWRDAIPGNTPEAIASSKRDDVLFHPRHDRLPYRSVAGRARGVRSDHSRRPLQLLCAKGPRRCGPVITRDRAPRLERISSSVSPSGGATRFSRGAPKPEGRPAALAPRSIRSWKKTTLRLERGRSRPGVSSTPISTVPSVGADSVSQPVLRTSPSKDESRPGPARAAAASPRGRERGARTTVSAPSSGSRAKESRDRARLVSITITCAARVSRPQAEQERA